MAHKHYVGAKGAIYVGGANHIGNEKLLAGYESSGEWVAEQKHDGWWLCVEVVNGEHSSFSRSANSLFPTFFNKSAIKGINSSNCVLVGELLKDHVALFDVMGVGGELTRLRTYESRRRLLESMYEKFSGDARNVFRMTRRWDSGFEAAFAEVIKAGGEGLMLKKVTSIAVPTNQQGKIDEWVKVKRMQTTDAVLVGFDKTPKGGTTCVWGMWDETRSAWIEVMKCSFDGCVSEERERFVGRVAEIEGFEVQKSGAVTSPGFVRWRDDKSPRDCVLPVTSEKRRVANNVVGRF